MRTPDRHRRLRAVFDEALLQEPSVRADYVRHACGSDPELVPEVLRLLVAHEDTRSFLDRPPDLLRSAARAEEPFPGTGRFRVRRRLGAGGMGVVYEVDDRVRDEMVALKTFLRTGAGDLYRLKREFRSLADVTHPNLVCLYELFVDEGRCFFTMELVPGVSFVDYVRSAEPGRRFNDRLIAAFRQLVAGVSALHGRGKLHRDIKPSNVLVTPEGRVVILDFGLAAELVPLHSGDVSDLTGGTPAYMAPEEGGGGAPSEAGDWYAVGVTLYEALTGTLPFAGGLTDLVVHKRTTDPLPPADLEPGAPADLSAICMGLLRREPEQRLAGDAALRLLQDTTAPELEVAPAPVRETPFVGRAGQLEALHEAFRAASNGDAAAVSICGPSGIGKSALVRCFLSQLSLTGAVVVLSGRCYENESVPYKALDGVVDHLSRHLASLSRADAEVLLPPDLSALTRVFPVLLQVPAIADLRGTQSGIADPFALRRRAFDALRELFRRVAARRPLVVCIDDLQWADADSIVLLEELLQPPGTPPLLTLLSFRSEETADKPFLQSFLQRAGHDIWSAIQLEPLTPGEAQALVGALVPADTTLSDHDLHRMTADSGGSPFVLEQLARYARVARLESHRVPTFAEMFAARLAALSAEARQVLETLAICGRPIASDLVCDASGVSRERQSLMAMLRGARFIRSSGSSARIETYHDRIRDVLAAGIAPEAVRGIHRRMVQALVARHSDDCEALFDHYRGAGDVENAAIQAGLAGGKAGEALAFDRSAFFYRHALALAPASTDAQVWREGLAGALANAGRPAEAGDAYLRAAVEAGDLQRVELQRRGAEQFLIGGHIDRGLELIHTMLASMGMRVPASPRAAVPPLMWRRARLRWRGLRFVRRAAADIDADTLLRLDTCWSAATGLLLVDMIGAVAFSARHVLIALDAGEPYRLSRALAIEAVARAIFPGDRALVPKLVQQSRELAREVGQPHAIGLCRLSDGMMTMARGEWKKALALSEEALTILRDQCVGVTWEVNAAQNLVIWALMYLGELGELSRRVPALLADAQRRGNLYIATELCTRSNYFWLAADDPDEGERVTLESIGRWSHKGFHRQHYSAMLARIQTALYRGDADAAWGLLAELDVILQRSSLTRIQVLRVEALYLRARSALAMAARHGAHDRFLPVARSAARRIARERMPWSDPIALLLEAAIASLEGRTASAVRGLHAAVSQFDRADMQLYAAVARRRLGTLQDDADGRAVKGEAEQWMAAQGIRNAAAMTRTLAPGFPDADDSALVREKAEGPAAP